MLHTIVVDLVGFCTLRASQYRTLSDPPTPSQEELGRGSCNATQRGDMPSSSRPRWPLAAKFRRRNHFRSPERAAPPAVMSHKNVAVVVGAGPGIGHSVALRYASTLNLSSLSLPSPGMPQVRSTRRLLLTRIAHFCAPGSLVRASPSLSSPARRTPPRPRTTPSLRCAFISSHTRTHPHRDLSHRRGSPTLPTLIPT